MLSRRWWQDRADDVGVALLTAMFLAFILQITARYVFNAPLSWTLEVCLTTWLWVVFWGSAFCLRHDEHIRFDMLYLALGRQARRVLAGISALAIVLALVLAWPGTLDFVSFLKIKKSATLRVPLNQVFSIYLVFMLATVLGYGARLYRLLRDQLPLGDDQGAQA